jgi:hypothetical protein
MRRLEKRSRQRGSILLEFALMISLLVFLGVGASMLGLNLDRQLGVTHLARSAADLMRADADLSNAGVRSALLRAARGLRISTTANQSQGVVIVSKLERGATGININKNVVVERHVIGNSAINASAIGTPASVNADGTVNNYNSDVSAVATLPNNMLLQSGQDLVVVEVYAMGDDIRFPGVVNIQKFRSIIYQ